MQALRSLGRVPPGLPQGKKIVAQAKARFAYSERFPARPAFGQPVATQEDMPGLGQSPSPGVINVSVEWTGRRPQRVEM